MTKYKRQHYIPQFILKNFCFDTKNNLNYYDYITGDITIKNIKDVFMEDYLYNFNIDNNDKLRIEKDFAKFESEVSKIFKKFTSDKEIIITNQEYDCLLVFLALLGFRSKNVKDKYVESKNILFHLRENETMVDFWKRNLSYLVNCRSLNEILNNEDIDNEIKIFMRKDIYGLFGKYIVVFESRGNEDFFIGDSYPLVITGEYMNLPIYDYFPISPNRVIVLVAEGIENIPQYIKKYPNNNLKRPIDINKTHKKIHISKIYQNDVISINDDIIKNSKIGIIYKDEERITLIKDNKN